MNRKIVISFSITVILLASGIAGMALYYNGKIASQNSQISNLKSQLTNLTSQINNLTAQITKLNSANLVANLTVTEVQNSYNDTGTYTGLNYLYISGGVTNTGRGTAYNAGLHVVAYTATGILEINMTVPLGIGGYGEGVNNSTNVLGTKYGSPPDSFWQLHAPITTVYSGAVGAAVFIAIYHEGTVTNWTVTPVWTNSQ